MPAGGLVDGELVLVDVKIIHNFCCSAGLFLFINFKITMQFLYSVFTFRIPDTVNFRILVHEGTVCRTHVPFLVTLFLFELNMG